MIRKSIVFTWGLVTILNSRPAKAAAAMVIWSDYMQSSMYSM